MFYWAFCFIVFIVYAVGIIQKWLIFRMYTQVDIGNGVDDFPQYLFFYTILIIIFQVAMMLLLFVTLTLFFIKACKEHKE